MLCCLLWNFRVVIDGNHFRDAQFAFFENWGWCANKALVLFPFLLVLLGLLRKGRVAGLVNGGMHVLLVGRIVVV